ncbi:MAG: ATP-binding protein [Planctomycetia bacterium]|nr:ATP-binding protein [Planctomycetia bacterium]
MESRNSGGRSFFESSLELKCLFFFGVALAIVITISFFLYFKVTKSQIDTQNPLTGKLLTEREFLLMHLRVLLQNESLDQSYSAPGSSELDDFIDSMTLQSEEISGQADRSRFECRLLRSRKRRPGEDDGPRNAFEEDLLKQQNQTVPPEARDSLPLVAERTDEVGTYHYYVALRMERACLNCHREILGDSSAELGSLLGILQVTIPEPPAQKEITRLWALLLGAAIITAFLSLIAFYIVIRLVIIRPLKNLREVSEAISSGDSTKRAELHTGDEFEALGHAFNQMLRHLVETQDELQATNATLGKNVDELARRNLQLFEMNQIKSDFMATMSHELRTPLNSILGFSEVLGSIKSLDDKQRRYVTNINKSGRALLAMINDILDMTRMDAGRLEIQLSHFTIDQIILALCDMARPLADKKNLDIAPEIEPDLPRLQQDASRIQQILNNLISNAIKFTPEGGLIRILAHRIERIPFYPQGYGTAAQSGRLNSTVVSKPIPFLELKVIDSGVGISPEDQLIIFKKFRQGKSSMPEGDAMTREHSGSGLGLSIVKELCKLLEGEVSVESRPGFGSTFTILLPWELNPPVRTESTMITEIQKFSQAGTARLKIHESRDVTPRQEIGATSQAASVLPTSTLPSSPTTKEQP